MPVEARRGSNGGGGKVLDGSVGCLFQTARNATFAQSQAKQTCRKSLVRKKRQIALASCMLWGKTCSAARGRLTRSIQHLRETLVELTIERDG